MTSAKNKEKAVSKTVKVQPYLSRQAIGYLKQLYNAGTYGNSINAVAQRMIEERLNELFDTIPKKRSSPIKKNKAK